MSKKAKVKPLPPHLTARGDGKEQFVRLSDSMCRAMIEMPNGVKTPNPFCSLSWATQIVYERMCLVAGDHPERFTFPKSTGERYGIPHQTLLKAIKALESAGFIETVENNRTRRKDNVYKFTPHKWRPSLANPRQFKPSAANISHREEDG